MKLRMYCIVNQYISGLHAGIQSAHAVVELMNRYSDGSRASAHGYTKQWAEEFKTLIVLDGGYQSNLKNILTLVEKIPSLPSAYFCEEEDALNGAMTAVAMVLPEYMFSPQYAGLEKVANTPGEFVIANQYKDPLTGNVLHNYSQYEKDLILALKSLRTKNA